MLRLVFDRDTGKPKGYGFCEYRDSGKSSSALSYTKETALSAIRNLNNVDFNGRNLRVDFADQEKQQMQVFLFYIQYTQFPCRKNY